MIELIDCNMRLGVRGRQTPGEPGTAEGLLAEMDRVKVRAALVRHQEAVESGPASANRRILEELDGQDRLMPTFCLLPEGTGETGRPEDTVDEMITLGVRAAWLYPKSHGYSLRKWCAGSMLSALEARRVPVFMHWDEIVPDELAEVLAGHPRLPIVLCNVSYRVARVVYPLMQTYPMLHSDLGPPMSLCGYIEEVVGRFGPERLLFGSGFPDQEMGPAITYLLYADISDAHKQRIGGGNLTALLEGATPALRKGGTKP